MDESQTALPTTAGPCGPQKEGDRRQKTEIRREKAEQQCISTRRTVNVMYRAGAIEFTIRSAALILGSRLLFATWSPAWRLTQLLLSGIGWVVHPRSLTDHVIVSLRDVINKHRFSLLFTIFELHCDGPDGVLYSSAASA
jgi:hypothetical protein